MSSLQDLTQQFALDNALFFEEHPSGLLIGRVQTSHCDAQFFLQGAHVTHFHPFITTKPLLFLSEVAVFEPARPIRGGIPICFPWFSTHPTDPTLPAHGWARTSLWQVVSTSNSSECVKVVLKLEQDDWHLEYDLEFGTNLQASLTITNLALHSRSCELALHTYFDVGSIHQVQVSGDLSLLPYLDQLTSTEHLPVSTPIGFQSEVDRIYQGSAPTIQLHDQAHQRTIVLQSHNSNSTIVWNPWIAKSIRMPDFGDLEYLKMCCIETANVRQNQLTLSPNSQHTTTFKITVSPSSLT